MQTKSGPVARRSWVQINVVDFDGGLYSILYQHDGDEEIFDESGFDGVEIVYDPLHRNCDAGESCDGISGEKGLRAI